ncbi:MAG TPA: hypothetical protein VEC57_16750 [Candidatus Limnocylindrales bacterium]|nr:hypothetical protein [Candidatus Limnocylindrales bacterium]
MADNEVQLSGSANTMAVIAMVAAVLSLALNFWNMQRINEVSASVSLDKIKAAHEAREAAGS